MSFAPRAMAIPKTCVLNFTTSYGKYMKMIFLYLKALRRLSDLELILRGIKHRNVDSLRIEGLGYAERRQKKAAASTAGPMIKDLVDAQQFHSAARVWNEIASTGRRVEMGQVTDGGLELILSPGREVFRLAGKNEPGAN